MPIKLLTAPELAEMIDASPDQLLSLAREGMIPSIKVEGRVYFNLAKVVRAIRAGRPEPVLQTV